MGEKLLETVKQVGIFMICAQMILHFKPAESYGKYIRLLMSVMVLVQLIVPVFNLFGGKGKESLQEKIFFYDKVLEENMEEISVTNAAAESLLEEMTLEEIKTRINNYEKTNAETNREEGDMLQSDSDMQQADANMPQNHEIKIERIEVTKDE